MNRIAAISGADGMQIQDLLGTAIRQWRAAGATVVGLLAENHTLPERSCAAGFLRDIGSGVAYPIYLETAPSHTSCHLDAVGVEAACAALLEQIPGSDIVVLSKFGKLEAAHAGLVPAFEAALASGKPILTSVSSRHRQAWQAFAPDALDLPAEKAAIERWREALDAG